MNDKTKKLGRPTQDHKNLRFTIRFNEQQSEKIKKLAVKKSVSNSEIVRNAIDNLPNE